MFDYDKKVEKNRKRNEKYINDYLNYHDITKAEEGIKCIHTFLDGWFIEKCLWASKIH